MYVAMSFFFASLIQKISDVFCPVYYSLSNTQALKPVKFYNILEA